MSSISAGVIPDIDSYKEKQRLELLFGRDYVQSLEREFDRLEELSNRYLVYKEEDWEQYHLKKYHVDIKPWLDYIDKNNMPLELYHNAGEMTWKENGVAKKQKVKVYRLLDKVEKGLDVAYNN